METVTPEEIGLSTERLARIDQFIEERYLATEKIAGAQLLVARHGQIGHLATLGRMAFEGPEAMREDAIFRIYSMTKPITATALMQLYEQGKFHLSDPVHKFVPELKDVQVLNEDGELVPVERPMTMQQLLTHTTGMSYGFNPINDPVDKLYVDAKLWAAKDLDDFAAKLAELPLKFQPGAQWHYSVAVDVTGLVVQRLSGQRFDEYLAEHIFAPLGMRDTFFAVPEAKAERFLPNHIMNPQTGKMITIPNDNSDAMRDYFNVSLFSGGGGLVSTAMDYMRFAEAMRNGGELDGVRILGAKTVDYMSTNHLNASISAGGNGETPALNGALRGFGFGLGFGLVVDPAAVV